MNGAYDLLMRKACYMSTLVEQAQCISLLMLSGKLSETENEVIEAILQEKFNVLVDTSSSIQSSIAFDFAPENEINTEKRATEAQNTFAKRLKLALKDQGVTQGVLADWTGISQSTISSMATGKIKNIDTPRAEAIAKALSVSFVWLMNGEGSIYGSDFLTNSNKV
ncbi:helix-turn-helix domain-containing protein [Providencia rettgeri]